jgi:cytochrome P450
VTSWRSSKVSPTASKSPSKSRDRARPGGLYRPFGTGERSCIGRQFALHEAVLILGAVIRRYDVIADPDYQLAIAERLTMMPSGFRLGLRRR